MALIHSIRSAFQAHVNHPQAPVSTKKPIWSEGWTANSDPNAVAQEMIASFSTCYTDLAISHLPTVLDSSTDAGKQSIMTVAGLSDPSGPKQYFFYGLLLTGTRLYTDPTANCLYDSEL